MLWQPVALDQLAGKQALAADALHVWWWPEQLQPYTASRRLRTDTVLRTLLARYLPLAPDALGFERESKGRPYLAHAAAPDFNLSDTRGGCVIAIAGCGRVGIDIECCDRTLPVDRLAARWFATDEAEQLRAMDPEHARRAFLRSWTAKESSCKATGTGIYGRLAAWRFVISDIDMSPRAIAFPPEAGDAESWCFHRLAPAQTHTVALACRDNSRPPRVSTS